MNRILTSILIFLLVLATPSLGADYWFVHTDGDAGNDGEQTAEVTGVSDLAGLVTAYSSGVYTITMSSSGDAAIFAVELAAGRDILHVSEASTAANDWWLQIDSVAGLDLLCSRFGVAGLADPTGLTSIDIIGTGAEATVEAALADAANGDTLYIAPGTYDDGGVTGVAFGNGQDNETLTISALDTSSLPILTSTNASVQHVVYIPVDVDNGVFTFSYIAFNRAADSDNRATVQNESTTTRLTFDHCTFDGADTVGTGDSAIKMENVAGGGSGRTLTLTTCTFDNYLRDTLIVYDTPSVIVTGCIFDQPGGTDGTSGTARVLYLAEDIGYVRLAGNVSTRQRANIIATSTSADHPIRIAGTNGLVEASGNTLVGGSMVYSIYGAPKATPDLAITWVVRDNIFNRTYYSGSDGFTWSNDIPYIDANIPGSISLLDNIYYDTGALAGIHVFKICAGSAGAEIARNKIYIGASVTGTNTNFPIVFKGPYGNIHHNMVYKPVDTGTACITLKGCSRTKVQSNSLFVLNGYGIIVQDQGAATEAGTEVGTATYNYGTCQAGSAAGTLVIDATSPAADNGFYAVAGTMEVWLTGGTGVGQKRLITAYSAATTTLSVAPDWTVTPDDTSTYVIGQKVNDIDIRDNLLVGSGANTILLGVSPVACVNWVVDYNAYWCEGSASLAMLGGTSVTFAQGISGANSTAARWLAWGPFTASRLNDANSIKATSNPLSRVSGAVATDSWIPMNALVRSSSSWGGPIGSTMKAGTGGSLIINPRVP